MDGFKVDSTRLLTGSADNSLRLWDVPTGKELFKWETKTAVRAVGFAEGDQKAFYITDATMGQLCKIFIVPIENDLTQREIFILLRGL